jgi:hypothetical protein
MSDWWASKLAPKAPQVSRPGIVLPPAMPRTPTPPPHHSAPGEYQQPPAAPVDPNAPVPFEEALARFSGGESARTERGLACPACGSRTGYTAFSGMGGMAAGVAGNRPAPHCMLCGYNGKFSQGDQANWAT